MQITKGEKSTRKRGSSSQKEYTWGGIKKKQGEKVEKKRRLILLSYYLQTEKQGTFEKETIIFEEHSQV